MGHIVRKLQELRDEWGEDIPNINAFVLKGDDTFTSWVCEYIFVVEDEDEQPSPQQVSELRASINAYDKWDKVLEAFRKNASND